MTGLGTELAPEIFAACQSGIGEINASLERCFELDFTLAPTEPAAMHSAAVGDEWQGAGLAVLFIVQEEAAVLFIPYTEERLASWSATPAATQMSKLEMLAHEIALVIFPETIAVDDMLFGHVAAFQDSLHTSGERDVCGISFPSTGDPSRAEALLLWPIANPHQILQKGTDEAAPALPTGTDDQSQPTTTSATTSPSMPQDLEDALPLMPPYIRSLLRIQVKVSVTLAQTSYPVKKILALAPGSIIQFDKSYDEPLELRVGEKSIGVGEAVKVGEKYGLRLNSMVLPEERFNAIGNQARRAS